MQTVLLPVLFQVSIFDTKTSLFHMADQILTTVSTSCSVKIDLMYILKIHSQVAVVAWLLNDNQFVNFIILKEQKVFCWQLMQKDGLYSVSTLCKIPSGHDAVNKQHLSFNMMQFQMLVFVPSAKVGKISFMFIVLFLQGCFTVRHIEVCYHWEITLSSRCNAWRCSALQVDCWISRASCDN